MADVYKQLVKKARKLVKMRDELKYEIARISLQACDKIKGGHIGKNTYTVKRFSDDIGVNTNTLQRWRREYELVISKIGINKPVRMALEETLKKVGIDTDPELVKKIYNEEKNKLNTKEDYMVRDIIKRLKTIDFSISCALNLKICNQEDLKITKILLDNISGTLLMHFNGKTIVNTKREKALKEVSALLS